MSVASPHTGDEFYTTSQADYTCNQYCCQFARFIPPPIEAGEFSRYLVKIVELQHPAPAMEYFNASLSVLELMSKLEKLYCDIEKKIQVRCRKEFANRLKQIRQTLGLTQKQFGDLIRVSPQVFSFYERGEHDIPVHTIIRLAKALNMNGNQILGTE